jgi:hypothetical protein
MSGVHYYAVVSRTETGFYVVQNPDGELGALGVRVAKDRPNLALLVGDTGLLRHAAAIHSYEDSRALLEAAVFGMNAATTVYDWPAAQMYLEDRNFLTGPITCPAPPHFCLLDDAPVRKEAKARLIEQVVDARFSLPRLQKV